MSFDDPVSNMSVMVDTKPCHHAICPDLCGPSCHVTKDR